MAPKSAQKKNEKIETQALPLTAQAKALGLPMLSEPPKSLDRTTLFLIPEETSREYKFAAFQKEKDSLHVAMVNPENFEALNVLRFLAEKERVKIIIYLTSLDVYNDIARGYANADTALKAAILSLKKEEIAVTEKHTEKNQAETFQDAPIAKLVEVIVMHALEGRASDIHIEPIDNSYRVRFRIDGLLRAQLVFPLDVGRAVISRIKILSNLKIDEKRKPQDGRFRFEHAKGVVDLRVSSLPVMEGEKIVMRVLDKSANTNDLEKLGLWGRNRKILEAKIREPFGIILITGPTGSGKSTTLYAFLQILNKEERNIITLEDPVEYFVEGINQSQIKPEIGYTFANGLRSILRQDPNIIMVGEVRDSETAELAIHAALTGHLVLSTLHTNDAIGAVPRLVDMGIEAFLLSSALQVVAAQRLVRLICEQCRTAFPLTPTQEKKMAEAFAAIAPEEREAYGLPADQKMIFFQGKGCEECGKSGYKGRIAIYEVIDINEQMHNIIIEKKGNEGEVRRAAHEQGMTTLKQDGILKALKGMTTLAEVERVTEGKILVDEE